MVSHMTAGFQSYQGRIRARESGCIGPAGAPETAAAATAAAAAVVMSEL